MAQPRLFPSPQAPDMNGAAPILKWAGGKGQLLPTLRKRFPIGLQTRQIQVYAEPFVGGGAVYFDLVQQFPTIERAFLFDVNPELVNLYTVLQQEVDDLADQLADLRDQYLPLDDDGRKAFYYRLRDEYNAQQVALSASGMNTTRIYRAAQTVFLNRTCFNGLFRVNARGAFNVPFGRNGNPSILDEKRLRASSAALELAEIRQADFSEVSTLVGKDSFVYYDPPYRPISSTSSFNSYMKGAFNDNEQIRLASHFHTLDQRGVKQLLSNSDPTNHGDDPFFDELYRGFTIERVKASRMINSKASKRGAVRELLVRNYEA